MKPVTSSSIGDASTSFPRAHARGPIEAMVSASTAGGSRADFRERTLAAPLKRLRVSHRATLLRDISASALLAAPLKLANYGAVQSRHGISFRERICSRPH